MELYKGTKIRRASKKLVKCAEETDFYFHGHAAFINECLDWANSNYCSVSALKVFSISPRQTQVECPVIEVETQFLETFYFPYAENADGTCELFMEPDEYEEGNEEAVYFTSIRPIVYALNQAAYTGCSIRKALLDASAH